MFAWNFKTGLVDSDILHRMPRKMRLSVYRKNQYRKPEAHSLEMEHPLFVSVPLESVSVMQVSISLYVIISLNFAQKSMSGPIT